MTQFNIAARAQIRNAVLCALATLTLAACGGESGSSSAAATAPASDSTASAGSPSTGTTDRSQGVDATESTAAAATVASNTPSSAAAPTPTTPASGTTSGTTTTTTNGVATLDWMPPTLNSDGSVLTNLAGYTVYYGTSPDSLTQNIKITNPGLSAYTVTDLTSGTWYFALTSYSSAGVESTRTGTVSTTI